LFSYTGISSQDSGILLEATGQDVVLAMKSQVQNQRQGKVLVLIDNEKDILKTLRTFAFSAPLR